MFPVTKASLHAVVSVFLCVATLDTSVADEVTGGAIPQLPSPDSAQRMTLAPESTKELPSANCFILGSRSFTIPFSVDAAGRQPEDVHLYVSHGENDSWELIDQKSPSVRVKQFEYTAQADGKFRFATRTIDSQGRLHPTGDITPQLSVYVDTTRPDVSIKADADANGRVTIAISTKDATPLKSVRLTYLTDAANQWREIPVAQHTNSTNPLQFTPEGSWQQLSLQCVVTDTPGNQSIVSRLLRRPRVADSQGSRFAANRNGAVDLQPLPFRLPTAESLDALVVSNPVIQLDRKRPLPAGSNLATAHGYAPARGAGPELNAYRGGLAPGQRSNARSAGTTPTLGAAAPPMLGQVPTSTNNSSAPIPGNSHQLPASGQPLILPRGLGSPNAAPARQLPAGQLASQSQPTSSAVEKESESILPPPATPEEISRGQVGDGFALNSPVQEDDPPKPVRPKKDPPQTAAEAMRPLTEMTPESQPRPDQRRSAVSEEIPTPSGEVDRDATAYQSRRLSMDPNSSMARAPIRYSDSKRFSLEYELEAIGNRGVESIELYGSVDSGRTWQPWGRDPDRSSPFDIEVKEEGVFGFRIVVVGQNGLASPRPLPGEVPDIVVVVDEQEPQVRITGAQYGDGDRIGSLVIQYECQDPNLMQRPIALSFSNSLNGPWTTIAAGLRNDGDYVWPADPQLPRRIYLRIDATDQAGNVSTYILDQPIDSQGLAPRARIRGFQSLSGGIPPTSDEQTARRPKAAFK